MPFMSFPPIRVDSSIIHFNFPNSIPPFLWRAEEERRGFPSPYRDHPGKRASEKRLLLEKKLSPSKFVLFESFSGVQEKNSADLGQLVKVTVLFISCMCKFVFSSVLMTSSAPWIRRAGVRVRGCRAARRSTGC